MMRRFIASNSEFLRTSALITGLFAIPFVPFLWEIGG